MTELRDIYTQHGERTKKTVSVAVKLQHGEYCLHTIVILRERSGMYLLAQRSQNMCYLPGYWDVTGGGVSTGETSLMAAIREVREELGLLFTSEQFVYGGRIPLGTNGILDLWGVCADFTAEDCVLQKAEVEAVRLVEYAQFRDTVSFNKSPLFMALMDDMHIRLEQQ